MTNKKYYDYVIATFRKDQMKKGYPLEYINEAIKTSTLEEIEKYLLRFNYPLLALV